MRTLKELLNGGVVSLALLPEMNDFLLNEEGKSVRKAITNKKDVGRAAEEFHDMPAEEKAKLFALEKLDDLEAYTIPLIAHDYGAKTPIMWNSLYNQLGLNIRNIMVIADPRHTQQILEGLKQDPKYIGGGAGVGFKESSMRYLDAINPVDLASINIIVREGEKLIGYNTDAPGFVKSLEDKLEGVKQKIEGNNFIVIGAGGVAKEVVRELAKRKPNYIAIANRTSAKARALADELERKYQIKAEGVGEHLTRGVLLNSEYPPAAIMNLSDKGSDGKLVNTAMFYAATLNNPEVNESKSRDTLRFLKDMRPNLVYADIVLPSSGKPISLRMASADGIGDKYLLDGKPMVVYQAAPAYLKIQEANPQYHSKKVEERQALQTFADAADLNRIISL